MYLIQQRRVALLWSHFKDKVNHQHKGENGYFHLKFRKISFHHEYSDSQHPRYDKLIVWIGSSKHARLYNNDHEEKTCRVLDVIADSDES